MPKSGTLWLRLVFLVAAALAGVPTSALAQGRGIAPGYFPPPKDTSGPRITTYPAPGYYEFYAIRQYPLLYSGEVWTGTVTNISGREISLGWIDKTGKIESFTGEVVPSYDLPTRVVALERYRSPVFRGVATPVAPPSASLLGQRVMAYYFTHKETVKLMDKKFDVSINFVFRLVRCDEQLSGCPTDAGSHDAH